MRRNRPLPTVPLFGYADIGFMYIIFFLITAWHDPYAYGVDERLPPWSESTTGQVFSARNVLEIVLDNRGNTLMEDDELTLVELRNTLNQWYRNEARFADYHISLRYPTDCLYEEYLPVKDAILNTHRSVRRELALQYSGTPYAELDAAGRRAIIAEMPLRLAETTQLWSAKGETEVCYGEVC